MASKFETIDIKEDEHYSTDGIVCPYCGYVHDFYDLKQVYTMKMQTLNV